MSRSSPASLRASVARWTRRMLDDDLVLILGVFTLAALLNGLLAILFFEPLQVLGLQVSGEGEGATVTPDRADALRAWFDWTERWKPWLSRSVA